LTNPFCNTGDQQREKTKSKTWALLGKTVHRLAKWEGGKDAEKVGVNKTNEKKKVHYTISHGSMSQSLVEKGGVKKMGQGGATPGDR